MSDEQRHTRPTDRLTRMCNAMGETFENHPEHLPDDKAVIFLDTDTHGGIELLGYEHDGDAVAAVLLHLRAIMRANGKDLMVTTLGEG